MGGDGARGDRGGKKETWRHLMQDGGRRRGGEEVGEGKGKEEMEGRRRRR